MDKHLYEELLGEDFALLHPGVRQSLTPTLTGRGLGNVFWDHALLARILRMPRPGSDIEITLFVTEELGRQTWLRTFGRSCFITKQDLRSGRLRECFGFASTWLGVRREGDALRCNSEGGTCLGVPIPARFSPRISATVVGKGDHEWRVEVAVSWFGTPVCHYEANLEGYDSRYLDPDGAGASRSF